MAFGSVGQVALDLKLNSDGFKKQLNNTVDQTSNKLKSLGSILGKVFAVGAIVSFGKACLDLGSDLAEVQNVVDVTFGDMSDRVNAFAENAITTYGLSEKVAKQYMGTFGAMSKSFGFTVDQSYEMSAALTGLAADVASFYNLSTDEAYTKMKAVYTGETEALKELGVVMTQDALDAYAMSHGFGKVTKNMTEQEKVSLRLAFVTDKLSAAGGDFSRTSGGWANQVRVLSLRFDALKASIGQGLISALTPVIQWLNVLLSKLQVVADAFASLMERIFGKADTGSGSLSSTSEDVGNIASGLDSATAAAKAFKRTTAGFDEMNIMSSGDSGSGSGGSGGVSSYSSGTAATAIATQSGPTDKLLSTFDQIKRKAIEITQITGLDTMWDKVKLSVGNVKEGVGNLFENLRSAIDQSEPEITEFSNTAQNTFLTMSQTITTIWGDTWLLCSEHFKKFTEDNSKDIESFISQAIKAFTSFGTLISDIVGDLFGSILDWWEEDGKRIWDEVLDCIDDIKKWVLDIWNNCIWPIVQNLIDEAQRLWDEHLKPLWDHVLAFLTSVWDWVKLVWDKALKPVVDWLVDKLAPLISDVVNSVVRFISDAVGIIVDVIDGIIEVCTGVITFVTGVFSGDWEKAWEGVKTIFKGIWDTLSGIVKGVLNLIIDALNTLWSGLYSAIRSIVNGVGSIVSKIGDLVGKDWGFKMPGNAPKIPRLATGGYVAANTPQLAVVGDNRHEGEIIAPESKIAEAVAAGVAAAMRQVMQLMGQTTGQTQGNTKVVLSIDGRELGYATIDNINKITRQTGALQLNLT